MSIGSEDTRSGRNQDGGFDEVHAGRTVVVAGGTGNVGRVFVRSFLEAGATVVVPSRSKTNLEELRAQVDPARADRLGTFEGNIGDEAEAPDLVRRIAGRHGPLHAAVTTLGRFVPSPSLLDASLDELEQVLDGYLIGHFVVARALIPALQEGGSYTLINGPLAFQPMLPSAGLVSTVTAAQAMLARVLMEQVTRVRVNELVLHTPFGWGEDAEKKAPVQQRDVARYLSYLASEHGDAIRGQSIHLDTPEKVRELLPKG